MKLAVHLITAIFHLDGGESLAMRFEIGLFPCFAWALEFCYST
jgi:hypothetical protein